MLSQFEIKVLTFFYHPYRLDLLPEINSLAAFLDRKSAILRLKEIGFLEEAEPFAFRITHAGHTYLDNLENQHPPIEGE